MYVKLFYCFMTNPYNINVLKKWHEDFKKGRTRTITIGNFSVEAVDVVGFKNPVFNISIDGVPHFKGKYKTRFKGVVELLSRFRHFYYMEEDLKSSFVKNKLQDWLDNYNL